jgi:7,8-dihydropterin-6-yl-methyl-4-(beta-D-ribofuranosyl)aminobenzene 5'-phosphate synthase
MPLKIPAALLLAALFATAQTAQVKTLRVDVLSTMLAEQGIGEWGFAALVEADGRRILFDTGARPRTVLENAREMKIDLSGVTDVILTHNHPDHTGGLVTLRRDAALKNPAALSRAHAGRGIFFERPDGWMAGVRKEYEAAGGKFVEYDAPAQLAPGVWLTGPVERVYPERNWGGFGGPGMVRTPQGEREDNVPEDQSLVVDTGRGLVVISGCGHAGIINTLEYARKRVRRAPVHAVLGGFHLFLADEATLKWTAGKMKEFGVENFLGAHCTGIEAVYRIRELAGLSRRTAAVGAVGSRFELGKGLSPGRLAQ